MTKVECLRESNGGCRGLSQFAPIGADCPVRRARVSANKDFLETGPDNHMDSCFRYFASLYPFNFGTVGAGFREHKFASARIVANRYRLDVFVLHNRAILAPPNQSGNAKMLLDQRQSRRE